MASDFFKIAYENSHWCRHLRGTGACGPIDSNNKIFNSLHRHTKSITSDSIWQNPPNGQSLTLRIFSTAPSLVC